MNVRLRQDNIIRSLRRKGTATIEMLAQEVGVSRRTVLRDLNALRDEGFIIHSEPGPGGGLQLDPKSIQTTVKLSVHETFALIISVSSMFAIGNIPFSGLADVAIGKIEKSLPTEKLHDLRQLMAGLYISKLAPQINLDHMGEMHQDLLPSFEVAYLQQLHLQFQYCDAKGNLSERLVEPQAMLILPPLWYLVGWDTNREDFRHFRMDRINTPKVIKDQPFLRRIVPFDDHVSPLRNIAR